MNCRRHAFTLIELLIVVAIIAILAAIAVPNFLEAQTRSKVTRVQADMRSLATAMESYQIDYNSYPGGWHHHWDDVPPQINAGRVLTSPVSYIAEAHLEDPFRAETVEDYRVFYQITTGCMTDPMTGRKYPRNCYAFISMGPDRMDDTHIGNFPWSDGGITYDGTNGTRSYGDIYRCQPRVPKRWLDPDATVTASAFF